MKAFLSIPVQGTRQAEDTYRVIASTLALLGCNVMNSSVLHPPKTGTLKKYTPELIHDELMELLCASSLFVADLSGPSLGVGYEIRVALERQVPCIFLCEHEKFDEISLMIKGAIQRKFEIVVYQTNEEIETVLPDAVERVLENGSNQ